MRINMEGIVPLVQMLSGWLTALKEKEHDFNFDDKLYQISLIMLCNVFREAIEEIFDLVPFTDYFSGAELLEVHNELLHLYHAFITTVPDKSDTMKPVHPDDVTEVEWIIERDGLPDWTVCWAYVSRCRLRPLSREVAKDNAGPEPVFESTRIKPGAMCFYDPEEVGTRGTASEWLFSR